jgi:hypothetical protein
LIQRFTSILLMAHSAQRHSADHGNPRTMSDVLSPLIRELERFSLEFEDYCEGPWWVGCDHPHLPGRDSDLVIPTITRGHFRLRVSDFQVATRLARFLSWCDLPEPGLAQESSLLHVHHRQRLRLE